MKHLVYLALFSSTWTNSTNLLLEMCNLLICNFSFSPSTSLYYMTSISWWKEVFTEIKSDQEHNSSKSKTMLLEEVDNCTAHCFNLLQSQSNHEAESKGFDFYCSHSQVYTVSWLLSLKLLGVPFSWWFKSWEINLQWEH